MGWKSVCKQFNAKHPYMFSLPSLLILPAPPLIQKCQKCALTTKLSLKTDNEIITLTKTILLTHKFYNIYHNWLNEHTQMSSVYQNRNNKKFLFGRRKYMWFSWFGALKILSANVILCFHINAVWKQNMNHLIPTSHILR